MTLLVVRVIVLCLLLIGTWIFGMLPICLRRHLDSCDCVNLHEPQCKTKKQRMATSVLIYFAGGVLLSTCLIHLLHEARQGFEQTYSKCNETSDDIEEEIPLFESELMSENITKFQSFTINKTPTKVINVKEPSFETTPAIPSLFKKDIFDTYLNVRKTSVERLSEKVESVTHGETLLNRNRTDNITEEKEIDVEVESDESIICNGLFIGPSFPLPECVTVCGFFLIYLLQEIMHMLVHIWRLPKKKLLEKLHHRSRKKELAEVNHSHNINLQRFREMSYTDQRKEQMINHEAQYNNFYNKGFRRNAENNCPPTEVQIVMQEKLMAKDAEALSDLLTVVALSFHSVFEGFAAGFQHSVISTWMLFFSLALHKFVSAFVVSLEILQSGTKMKVAVCTTFFSLMTPLGMVVAIIAHENLEDSSYLIAGILNALSVGTLLYVTFFEMLRQRQDYSEISGFAGFGAAFLGFLVVTFIEYLYTRVEET